MRADRSWLQRFRSELKRRRMYRAAATYGAGVFVAWQVVDLVGSALGWPDSVLTFMVIAAVAFSPVVLGLSWIFDLHRSPGDEPGPEPGNRIRPRFSGEIGIGIGAVGIGALLAWIMWPGPLEALAGFRPGDRVLISPCENATGDPSFDGLLDTALEAAVRQSSHVETVSHAQALSYASGYLGRTVPADTLNAELARDIAIRMGLKVVINCSIRRVDDRYQVSGTITQPANAASLRVFSRDAAGNVALFRAIDVLAGDIRRSLGESLRTIAEARPLAEVTTPSLGALVSYTKALDAQARGDYDEAAGLFEAALDQDSMFARAHAGLGTFHYFFRRNIPLAEEHFRKALRQPERISERDRLWIEASWASNREEYRRAIALYDTYLERWPGDATGWYNLGTQYFRLEECAEASTAFHKALALNPGSASSYVNLASCLARIGKPDSALVYYDSVFRLRPDWKRSTTINHDYGQNLLRAGRIAEAEQVYQAQLDGSPNQQAAGRRSLALLRMLQGRYSEARPLLDEAARQQQAMGNGLSEYRDRLFLAGVLETLGEQAASNREMDRVGEIMASTYISPAWAHYAFRRYVARNQLRTARALLDKAEADTLAKSTVDRASVLAMQATMLLKQGRHDEALAKARLAVAMDRLAYLSEPLCRIALIVGDLDVAGPACGRLTTPLMQTGWEAQESAILSHYWLARAREAAGDSTAASLYARFLEFWGQGEEDLLFRDLDDRLFRPVQDARERLAKLVRERS